MSVLNQLESDYQQALKNKNQLTVSTLRMLLAALKYEVINKQGSLDDDDITKVIKSEIKKRKEAIMEYEKGNRMELADKEKEELLILEKYLPEQLSEEQIREKVKVILAELGKDINVGQAMGKVMATLKNQADGNVVRRVVEEELKDK